MKRMLIILLVVMIAGLSALSAPAKSKPQKPPKKKGGKRVDINFATVEELQTRLDIDAETAQKVIENRPYKKKKDLNEVLALDKREFVKLLRNIVVRRSTINFARLEELQTLPGIDAEAAQEIIDGRPYETAEDLLELSGIDEKILENLEGFIQIRMNINDATLMDLQKLPGVNPEIAHAIIEGRSYEMVEELLLIDGIDESVLAQLQDLIEAKPAEQGSGERGRKLLPGQGTGR